MIAEPARFRPMSTMPTPRDRREQQSMNRLPNRRTSSAMTSRPPAA
ncbi:MAG: hypothetical protein ACLUFV_06260 [Acutalibacteraceae bacterium]